MKWEIATALIGLLIVCAVAYLAYRQTPNPPTVDSLKAMMAENARINEEAPKLEVPQERSPLETLPEERL